jgi:hypothetical protein
LKVVVAALKYVVASRRISLCVNCTVVFDNTFQSLKILMKNVTIVNVKLIKYHAMKTYGGVQVHNCKCKVN